MTIDPTPDALTRAFNAIVENRLMPALVFRKSLASVLDTCARTMSSSAVSQEAELYPVIKRCMVWPRARIMCRRSTAIDR